MFHRRPVAFSQLSSSASLNLARLSAMESFARAVLVSIVPLVALEALGSTDKVARMYLLAAVLTLLVTLNIGTLERLLRRRWVVTLGGLFLIAAALSLLSGYAGLLPLGIGLRSAAASIYSVCLSLYIMDYVGKQELTRNESRRMQYAGAAWLLGPVSGSWLVANGHDSVPFLISILSAMAMLVYFWRLRLGSDKVLSPARSSVDNPLRSIAHFWRQKRLRIAYGITLSRSSFWVALYVYGPIYVIEAGLPVWVSGVLLSGVSALLFFSPLVRAVSDRFGTRQIVYTGLLITGFSLLCLGIIGPSQPLGLVFWVTGAIGGVLLDVLGNIPFMRSVKPRERVAMTAVFSTWREGSELLTPLLVTLVLLQFDYWVFYILLALMHFSSAIATSFLPKRL